MGMRLLPKSDVDRAKANAQKREADEGLKLARRVDNLRQVAATEEANLEKFRREKTAEIHAELTQATEKRDGMLKEVKDLEQRRAKALQPLDDAWAEVRSAQELNKAASLVVAEEAKEVAKTRREAEALLKKAQGTVARTATKEAAADKRSAEAYDMAQKAEAYLKEATAIRAGALALEASVTKELTHRDMEAAARERGLTMKEDNLTASKAELAKEWALLEDRKAAFARQVNRAKK